MHVVMRTRSPWPNWARLAEPYVELIVITAGVSSLLFAAVLIGLLAAVIL